MSDKLNWTYVDGTRGPGEYHAHYRGFRIRACYDDGPANPFEDWDGHWPMLVCTADRGSKIVDYDTKLPGARISAPLERFTDAHLVHDQKAVAKILDANTHDLLHRINAERSYEEEVEEVPKWVTDADALRDWFNGAWDDVSEGETFAKTEELFDLLGIPCLHTTSTGCSQGDWAELLIAATPEAQQALRRQPKDMSDEDWTKALAKDVEAQADLYGYWAWGDVYGYVVDKRVEQTCPECAMSMSPDDDECPACEEPVDPEWDDACDHNSCWGYYGDDFVKSGLEEQARDAIDHLLDNPTTETGEPTDAET